MSNSPLPPVAHSAANSRPKKSKKGCCLVLVLIPTSLLLLAIGIAGIGFLFVYTAKSVEVTANDRQVILDINDLAEWMEDYSPESQGETYAKHRYIDGSYDVEYEYDRPLDSDAPYLSCSVTVEMNRSDARASYLSIWTGGKLGISLLGDSSVDLVERNDLFAWGDESKMALLTVDGVPLGNVFITRVGNTIFYLTISGLYFDEPELLDEFLSEKLSRLETYEP